MRDAEDRSIFYIFGKQLLRNEKFDKMIALHEWAWMKFVVDEVNLSFVFKSNHI